MQNSLNFGHLNLFRSFCSYVSRFWWGKVWFQSDGEKWRISNGGHCFYTAIAMDEKIEEEQVKSIAFALNLSKLIVQDRALFNKVKQHIEEYHSNYHWE